MRVCLRLLKVMVNDVWHTVSTALEIPIYYIFLMHRTETLFLSNFYKTYSNIYPTSCYVTQFILSGNCSTCFGSYHHPSSGAKQLYLQHLVFVRPLLLSAAIAAGGRNGVTNTRCCWYLSHRYCYLPL